MTIRWAVPGDLDAVREVFRAASLSNAGDRATLLAHPEVLRFAGGALAEGRTRVAVGGDGAVVGFATTRLTDGVLELEDLFVPPRRMRQGVGGRLVEDVLVLARGLGVGGVVVTANAHAMAFYRSVGFVPDGVAQTRFGPAPRMWLDVTGRSSTAEPGPSITFVLLRRADFPLLSRWLGEPLVARWWNHETSAEAVERDFGPSVDGADSTEVFLAAKSGRRFGLIQRYMIAAYPEYVEDLSRVCVPPPAALSIDYLIGDPASRGRGRGAAMIAQFVATSWADCPDATAVVVPVNARNEASWRALEHAGFRRIAAGELEPDNPLGPRDHYVYRIDRPADC